MKVLAMNRDVWVDLRSYAGEILGELFYDIHDTAERWITGSDQVVEVDISGAKSLLIEYNSVMSSGMVTPGWSLDGGVAVYQSRLREAYAEVTESGNLFYAYVLVLGMLGGFSGVNLPLLSEYPPDDLILLWEPYIMAKKLEKEFTEKDKEVASENTHLAKSVDEGLVPPYVDQNSIVIKGGKLFLTFDILKAITAAGGVAQALEREDLEGGLTSGAKLLDKRDSKSDSKSKKDKRDLDSGADSK